MLDEILKKSRKAVSAQDQKLVDVLKDYLLKSTNYVKLQNIVVKTHANLIPHITGYTDLAYAGKKV